MSLHVFSAAVGDSGTVKVQSDSTAALGVAMKLASPRRFMNALAAEMDLQLEIAGTEMILTEHIQVS